MGALESVYGCSTLYIVDDEELIQVTSGIEERDGRICTLLQSMGMDLDDLTRPVRRNFVLDRRATGTELFPHSCSI